MKKSWRILEYTLGEREPHLGCRSLGLGEANSLKLKGFGGEDQESPWESLGDARSEVEVKKRVYGSKRHEAPIYTLETWESDMYGLEVGHVWLPG
jgi:hypothetical protein